MVVLRKNSGGRPRHLYSFRIQTESQIMYKKQLVCSHLATLFPTSSTATRVFLQTRQIQPFNQSLASPSIFFCFFHPTCMPRSFASRWLSLLNLRVGDKSPVPSTLDCYHDVHHHVPMSFRALFGYPHHHFLFPLFVCLSSCTINIHYRTIYI